MIERLCTKIAAVVSVCKVGYEERGDDLFCHWNAAFAIDNGKKKRTSELHECPAPPEATNKERNGADRSFFCCLKTRLERILRY